LRTLGCDKMRTWPDLLKGRTGSWSTPQGL
jgi:hypothetical protein